jgi:hypothetical protein
MDQEADGWLFPVSASPQRYRRRKRETGAGGEDEVADAPAGHRVPERVGSPQRGPPSSQAVGTADQRPLPAVSSGGLARKKIRG